MAASVGILLGLLFCAHAVPAVAQTGVFGAVRDSRGEPLAGAEVQAQSESTGARWKTRADDDGRYTIDSLPPATYKVTVRMAGFRTAARSGVTVAEGAGRSLDFGLELLGLHEVITVVSGREQGDPAAGESLLVTRDSPGATLPANGRDYRMLFDLMPGVIVTPAGVSDAGQFAANGQRPNSNSFRVDGVSANTGVGGSVLPGSFPGTSLPSMTAIGSTENLGSPETTQAVELRTSGFASETGERPGAEALVTTRSGSNQFHGDFFTHVRDNGWAARDWFANSRGIDFPRPSYDSLGGVVGGPILRNRTFFFLSAEKSTLSNAGLALIAVPSLDSRRNAPDGLQQILNGFPNPTGPDLGGGEAEGLAPLGKTAHLTNFSLRLDQALGSHGAMFARFVSAPSWSLAGYYNANQGKIQWRSDTIGVTIGRGWIHDFRLNYSRATFNPSYAGSPWGWAFYLAGLIPAVPQLFMPNGIAGELLSPETMFGLSVHGLGQFVAGGSGQTRQDQWELRHTFSRLTGRHQIRGGIDWIRIQPSRDFAVRSILGVVPSLQSLLDGGPLAVTMSDAPKRGDRIHTISLFAQDTVRLTDALSLVFGLRWEVTPPTSDVVEIPSVSGLWSGGNWQTSYSGDINGSAQWPMRYGQVTPRIGVSYRLAPGLLLRGGAGLFYDTALGAAISPVNGAPFNSWQLAAGATGVGPSSGGSNPSAAFPPGSGEDVTRFLLGPQPPLGLPASYQWRIAVEKSTGAGSAITASYQGALGRRLLGNQAYIQPDTGILTRSIVLTRNSSDYQAMQLHYTGSIGRKIYGSVSYTWSHSIDDGSQDSSVFLVHPGYSLREARASSSFDVRQMLTAALSYHVPRASGLPIWLADWTLSGVLRIRGGFPIDVMNSEQGLGRGFDNIGRPDLVPGIPVWIENASVAGHRRLNPAAFATPPPGRPGSLGRNAISGNGLAQLDVSLRRQFPLYRQTSLEVGLSVFNVLNHPAFADPVPYRSSPWFGQSTSMQNLMLGSGTPNTGLAALFQTGGPRSAEFNFRLSF